MTAIIQKSSRTIRIAILLLAVLLWTGGPLHAGPVTGVVSGAAYLAKGLIGLPFQAVGAVAKGIAKSTGKTGIKVTQK